MITNRLYSEILQEFSDAKTEQEKIAVLQKYKSERFEKFLFYAFSPDVQFDFPFLRYRPAVEPAGLNYTYLANEIPKLHRFIKNHPDRPDMTQERIKTLLTVILESLHKDEASLLVTVLSKQFNVEGLTIDLIKKVYTGINL